MQFTKAEEEVMKYLWQFKSCYMKDLIAAYPEPRPAYTTVATLVSRMVDKGYIGFEQRGSVREYYPKVKKEFYFKGRLNEMISNFFDNSAGQFASFFTGNTELKESELEELQELIAQKLKEKKNG